MPNCTIFQNSLKAACPLTLSKAHDSTMRADVQIYENKSPPPQVGPLASPPPPQVGPLASPPPSCQILVTSNLASPLNFAEIGAPFVPQSTQ